MSNFRFKLIACLFFSSLFILACQNRQQEERVPLLSEEYDPADTSGRAINPENSDEVFYERDKTRTKAVQTKMEKEIEVEMEPGVPAMIEPVFPKYWRQDHLSFRMLTEVEEEPLFSPFCASEPQPKVCSDRLYREYIAGKRQEMQQLIDQNQQTVQWLRLRINKEGLAEDVVLVNTWGVPCTQCAELALDWIRNMPEWEPARKNGQPVSAQMEIPVVF